MQFFSNHNKQIVTYSSFQLVKDILKLLKPYKWRFFFASLLRLLGDLAWLYPAYALAFIITFLTEYKAGDPLNKLWLVVALFFVAIVIRTVGLFLSKHFGYAVGEKIAIDSTLNTVKHMFRLDMSWHERENSGNKIKRIQNAGDGLNKIVRMWFNNLIEITVNLIAINIIIAQFDKTVLLMIIVFLVSYFIISGIMTRKASQASYKVNIEEENVHGLLFEAVNNIRTVKVMSMIGTLYKMLTSRTDILFRKLKERIFLYQSRNAFLSFWGGAFKIAIMVFIIKGILDGQYTVGFLILFNMYFGNLRDSIDELSFVSVDFVAAKLSVSRMKAILDQPITIDDEKGKKLLSRDWKKITIQNISFSYGDNKVLDNVSFEVRRGEKIGIVGLSGAGKSTLFKLLLKEREEFAGDILFDSTSIKKIKSNDYFKVASVVLQDTEVFNFSLKDNITITNVEEEKNEKLLKKALSTAHITDLVAKLPDGLNTLIGEKGVKLSGGERQRLGIARAIFKEPQILLLDEATSHLDLESEEKIRDSLNKFFETVTAIVIAHRLTTIKQMDKILVIEDGKIIESGNFEKLYADHGRFYELWEKQKL